MDDIKLKFANPRSRDHRRTTSSVGRKVGVLRDHRSGPIHKSLELQSEERWEIEGLSTSKKKTNPKVK